MSKFCMNCGAMFEDENTKFCTKCGKPLDDPKKAAPIGNPAPDLSKPQQPQYGAQPQQLQYGAQPQQPQYGAQPQQPQYGAQPQQPQYGAQPQQPQYGAQAQQPQYGAQPQQPQYGAQPQQPQYGAQPQQPQYGAQPQQPQYGAQPQQPQYGAQPQQPQYGAQPQQPQYGAQPQQPQYGAQPQQPQYGAQPQQPYGAQPQYGGYRPVAATKKSSGAKTAVIIIIVIALLGGAFAAVYFTGLLDGLLGVSKSSTEYPVYAFVKAIKDNDPGLVDSFIAEPADSFKEENTEYVAFVKDFIKNMAAEAKGSKLSYEILETTDASSGTLSEVQTLYKDITEAKTVKAKLIIDNDGDTEMANYTFVVVKQKDEWKLYEIK